MDLCDHCLNVITRDAIQFKLVEVAHSLEMSLSHILVTRILIVRQING